VDFSPDEVVTPESDPPDVVFRDARLEVMIVLDKGRKMHAAWKKEANRRDSAQTLNDLVELYPSSVPISFEEAVSRVVAELGPKASHYGPKHMFTADALVYIDRQGRHLYPLSEASVPGDLRGQGWRSVSFLFPPYSHVLFAAPEAPEFLLELEGLTKQECTNPDVWFDL
jgi:hypothetical protein